MKKSDLKYWVGKEIYYIDFHDCEIYSYEFDIEHALDRANVLVGNAFESFADAKTFLQKLLDRQKTS